MLTLSKMTKPSDYRRWDYHMKGILHNHKLEAGHQLGKGTRTEECADLKGIFHLRKVQEDDPVSGPQQYLEMLLKKA